MSGVKRQRATALAEQLLTTLDHARHEWPLSLITEVYVFGSYARGATEPHDLDIDVEINRGEERYRRHFVTCLSAGRDPNLMIRRALVGSRRGCQFVFEARQDADFPLTLLWRRGDSLAAALDRLHAIPVDETATRAARDGMLPEFEGLDQWIARPYREAVNAAVQAGAIRVQRLELFHATVVDPDVRDHIRDRWAPTSPLFRAAHAVLAHLEQRGVDLAHVHLHGRDVDDPDTPYFVGFGMRYFRAVPHCLAEYHAVEWIEVVHPTRTGALHALRILPTRTDLLAQLPWS
jgi:hypothetical protein